ncbi:DUF898 family protein [Rhodophyticola sp.]|jgi:uncharacterized membrane protein YjgN (DUF898 family)|uniref:DUF898 family protein n=1 Tax=Rhodophyticola sp. TaxID=2680032 RepID=UPI001B1EAA74|nr:DUF898 family protein [Roseicyclus sp.]MBO6624425.1 DUF898 family protein [Roseicyclus sp.]MBO6922649.1 DUF898 family protein [Roseicyclus sp.]
MPALKTEFAGDRGDLFQLAFRTGLLTVITFGLYRFWQTTRFRRWYWSSVRPGGTPMEYTGTGQEKLIGFLFAIILLAIYLALFNALAMLAAIFTSQGASAFLIYGLTLAPLSLIPVIFVARYRARRYIMSRSRWRGIRFAMSPGAWGYAWRACLYGLLVLLSFGLLLPLRTFQLEKYLTDRSWFGTARFTQFGHFGQLYGPVIPFLFCLYGTVAMMVYGVLNSSWTQIGTDQNGMPLFHISGTTWPFLAIYPAGLLILLFAAYYRVASFRIMASMKTLGDGLEFDIHPRTRSLVRIHILGSILTGVASGLAAALILALAFGVMAAVGVTSTDLVENPPVTLIVLTTAMAVMLILVFYNVFRQLFLTFPMVRHVAETLEIHEPELLETIRQRDREDTRDAGGFADALDVGAAF